MSVQLFESEILNVNLTSLVSDDGETYFKAKDVAIALGYVNTRDAVDRHVWDENKFEWCNINRCAVVHDASENVGGIHPRTLFLTEPGVYQLIFKSELPTARLFQKWVFSEVLPSIRKTGSYTLKDPIEKIQSITLEDLSGYDKNRRRKYKTVSQTHANMLKNPVNEERGRRGGLKSQENRRKLVEFKNMFIGLYETLFGPDE